MIWFQRVGLSLGVALLVGVMALACLRPMLPVDDAQGGALLAALGALLAMLSLSPRLIRPRA